MPPSPPPDDPQSILLSAGFLLPLFWATALIVGLMLGARHLRLKAIGRAEVALGLLARRRGLTVFLVGAFAFVLNMSVSLLVRWPQPHIHDEFCYLLAADTFAHGRLSNPTPPFPQHFESFHLILTPSYVSKYPPGQGLFLALGQVLTGQPLVGVWLSVALACAALCWMLQAWLPSRWAALGGLLSVLHPMVLKWGQCYWGGAVAMLGGVLVVGAVRRLAERPCRRDGLWLGLGISILMLSRPCEGLILTALSLAALGVWLLRGRMFQIHGPRSLLQAFAPAALVMTFAICWLGFYDFRTTGSPTRMPYMIFEETYQPTPFFLWQPLRHTPAYHNKPMRDFLVTWAVSEYRRQHGPLGFLNSCVRKTGIYFRSTVQLFDLSVFGLDPHIAPGPVAADLRYSLVVPLLALPWVWRRGDRWQRLALGGCALFTIALLPETWVNAHYAAPVVGLTAVALLQSMRRLRAWRWHGRPAGLFGTRLLIVLFVASFLVNCGQLARPGWGFWTPKRTRVIARLDATPGRHLVLVRYTLRHDPVQEWVFNGADLDHARIIWARSLTPPEDQSLVNYYHDRHAWLLDADANPPRLTPYPLTQALAAVPPKDTRPSADN